MAKSGNVDFDDFDLPDSDEDEMEHIGKHEGNRRDRKARRELDRRMDMKRLRDMIDDYDIDDFD